MSINPSPEHSRPAALEAKLPMRMFGVAALVFSLGGCSMISDYIRPELTAAASTWSIEKAPSAIQPLEMERWWSLLHDPAIDSLTDAAFTSSPTLLQAVARIDEARATLGVNTAGTMPTAGVAGAFNRAKVQNTSAQTSSLTQLTTSSSFGPNFSWELDLFGRVRHSVDAAKNRLDARTADATSTRLSLAADVANGVLSLRACENSRRVLADDIASREKTLALTRLKLAAGFVSSSDEARATSGLASVRTNLATQEELCARQVNALVALTGKDAAYVRREVGLPSEGATLVSMPIAPTTEPALPATVLANHPNVISADREAAAAWAEIGVARANRLPRFDLTAALTGQWIRAAGSTLDFTTWSLGPSIAGTLFDGGAGASNVSAAEARYKKAGADLESVVRSTVQDVENALAAQVSAKARLASSAEAAAAARITLNASEAQWKVGTISLFELEDSRRQFASAQDTEIAARRDQAQAWIALVKATGGSISTLQEPNNHD